MNFSSLILWSTSIIIGLAGVRHLDDIHRSVLKAQAKLIYDSRTETWGSPRFLLRGAKARKNNIKRRAERLP